MHTFGCNEKIRYIQYHLYHRNNNIRFSMGTYSTKVSFSFSLKPFLKTLVNLRLINRKQQSVKER
jgi:hypothetical protein